jgi:hypothetical protein
VSCTSASSCTAVGYWSNDISYMTLVSTWNGTAWSQAASPTTSSRLLGVACTTGGTVCTAVGYQDGNYGNSLAERN